MKLKQYLYDKINIMSFFILTLILVDCILSRFPLNWWDILVINFILVCPWVGYGIFDFCRRRSYYIELKRRIEQMDQPFLLGELLPNASFLDGKELNEVIQTMTMDLNNRLARLKAEQNEYYEYVELWVHEIKLPLASLQLMIDNQHLEVKEVQKVVNQMTRLIQQSLFYAKSTKVNQDYHIHEQSSKQLLMESIARYSKELIGYHFQIELPENDSMVKTDKQWISFILGQVIGNAIKYRRDDVDNRLRVEISKTDESVEWAITDFGKGISAQDLAHIFEKGYTGENGRHQSQATGIGLYLCRKLCQQLAIEIDASSIEGEQTTIYLRFPIHETTLL